MALDEAEGQAVVHKLLGQADVMITNLLPDRLRRQDPHPTHIQPAPTLTTLRALRRYDLEFENCQKINPALIIASVSSYGLEGPSADWPVRPFRSPLLTPRAGAADRGCLVTR